MIKVLVKLHKTSEYGDEYYAVIDNDSDDYDVLLDCEPKDNVKYVGLGSTHASALDDLMNKIKFFNPEMKVSIVNDKN